MCALAAETPALDASFSSLKLFEVQLPPGVSQLWHQLCHPGLQQAVDQLLGHCLLLGWLWLVMVHMCQSLAGSGLSWQVTWSRASTFLVPCRAVSSPTRLTCADGSAGQGTFCD